MTKVCKNLHNLFYLIDVCQVASEALSALRTVQSFNAVPQEERKFHDKVSYVLTLARREAIASGIFFGSTGWSGNVTLLGLLGYGRSSESEQYRKWIEKPNRWNPCLAWGYLSGRPYKSFAVYGLCGQWIANAHVSPVSFRFRDCEILKSHCRSFFV